MDKNPRKERIGLWKQGYLPKDMQQYIEKTAKPGIMSLDKATKI
jgi:hypothetical protein